MSYKKKSNRILPNEKAVDTELVYSRALALQASSKGINAKALFSHEPFAIPIEHV